MRTHPRSTYFGVNQVGLATSYGVAGRRGEVRGRFMTHDAAQTDCRRLNRAYALGWKHAADVIAAQAKATKPR